jgi:hypothetical protein
MKKLIPLLLLLAIVSISPSCNKNDATVTPDIIDSVKIFGVDSTQLVQSITTKGIDKAGNYLDSETLYIYYDTLNKRAIFSSAYTGSANNPTYIFEQTYDNKWRIVQQKVNPLAPGGSEGGEVDYSYDDKGIVTDETFKSSDGTVQNEHLQKTDLPGGSYSLSTVFVSSEFDSSLYVEVFDPLGNELSNSAYSLPTLALSYKDSVLYDAAGNVSKVLETSIFGPTNQPQQTTYSLFEFTRDTRGSQLSDFNNILFNGVSKFSDFDENSINFNGFRNFYYYQFTRFPFNPKPQYDNVGRLVKYKMYNGDDPYFYEEFDIGYYK